MILFVAPYGGEKPEDSPFLAGAKKIRFMLRVLKEIDPKVVLLNSGHRGSKTNSSSFKNVDVGSGVTVDMYTPPIYSNAWVGRSFNILNAGSYVREIVKQYGEPDVAWLYNGYAFESKTACILKKKFNTKIISEFEDWHFARNRGFNPKPFIDFYFWKKSLRCLDYGFAVNSYLSMKFKQNSIPSIPLPGVLEEKIVGIHTLSPPFTIKDRVVVGYFGGLSYEKGAGLLIDIIKNSPNNVSFIVTGRGELEKRFEDLAAIEPGKLSFLGAVSDKLLYETVAKVDVIINPHSENSGVFPFKILEAIASGRLVLSTILPVKDYKWIEDAIYFSAPNVTSFCNALGSAFEIYQGKQGYIKNACDIAINSYSKEGVIRKVREALDR